MEKDNEINVNGGSYDFGARIYDSRLGRWLSLDPLMAEFPDISPYCGLGDNPISIIDPDGRVIIYVNGYWGFPTYSKGGGTKDYWGEEWVADANHAIGDYKNKFYDGKGSPFSLDRYNSGIQAGKNDARTIINSLKDGETIKFVTNSMGTAFSRGLSKSIIDYKNERLKVLPNEILSTASLIVSAQSEVNFYENALLSDPNNEDLNFNLEMAKNSLNKFTNKKLELFNERNKLNNLEIEMVIDLSSHQWSEKDPNAKNSYYSVAGEKMAPLEDFFVQETEIEGATKLKQMDYHHGSGADAKSFPSSKNRQEEPQAK